MVTYTTRPIRVSETDGIEYFFVDEAKLNELKKQNKVIEHRTYNTVHGPWHYFTVDDGQIDLDKVGLSYVGNLGELRTNQRTILAMIRLYLFI